jgi:uncharacterized protein (TIGR02118 family)
VIKLVCFMNRKQGMSMQDFVSYYEERHVPLINRLVPFHSDYRRNFIVEGSSHRPAHLDPARGDTREFDVMTELIYETPADYHKVMDALADPEIGRIIAGDEAKFFDRASIRTFVVDERRSI